MNLAGANVVLRPRSPGSVGDLALRYVVDLAPRKVLALCTLSLVPAWLCAMIARLGFEMPWGYLWLGALAYVALVHGLFTVLFGRLLFDREVSLRSVLAAFAKRAPAYLWLGAYTLVVVVVTIAVPLLWVRWAYYREALLLEDLSGTQALRRSNTLRARSTSDVVAMLALVVGFHVALPLCFEMLGRGAIEWLLMMPRTFAPFDEVGGSPFALLGFLAAVPFASAARFLMYIDARTKQDGWDVQVEFMRIANSDGGSG